jgi:hypothetical protein
MASKTRNRLVDRIAQMRSVRRWQKAAEYCEVAPLTELRDLQANAHQLREKLDRVEAAAFMRLTRPRIGSKAMAQKPRGTDWDWRPEIWARPLFPSGYAGMNTKSKLGDEVTFFHDCRLNEMTLRQLRNTDEDDLAPFSLRLEAFGFRGSFISLAIDMPQSSLKDLSRQHIIQVRAQGRFEREMELYARLNIQNGPNTEQETSRIHFDEAEGVAEFDLAYTKFNESRVEKMWVDLIFEGVSMNQILLRDLTMLRYKRAEL